MRRRKSRLRDGLLEPLHDPGSEDLRGCDPARKRLQYQWVGCSHRRYKLARFATATQGALSAFWQGCDVRIHRTDVRHNGGISSIDPD
jgi:hypothetical protein